MAFIDLYDGDTNRDPFADPLVGDPDEVRRRTAEHEAAQQRSRWQYGTKGVNPDEFLDAARRSSQGYNTDPWGPGSAYDIAIKGRQSYEPGPYTGPYVPPKGQLDPWGPGSAYDRYVRKGPGGLSTMTPLSAAPRYQGGGVDLAKWTNPQHSSPKYEVLRYLDQFDPMKLGRQGLLALAPDQRAGLEKLGYQVRDEDKIFRNDIGEIDVLHGKRDQYGWRLTGVGNQPKGKVRPKPLPKVSIIDRPPGWSGGGGINPPGPPNLPPGGPGGGGRRSGGPGGYTPPGGLVPPGPNRTPDYQSQFTDPLTQQYEQMLEAQKRLYGQQQTAMEAEGQRQQGMYDALMQQYQQQLQFQTNLQQQQQMRMQLEQGNQAKTREQAEAARQRLTDYANQRIGKLQGPAYTGTEQEVIRTQYLDPIERDRAATRQRALQNVGSRGFDPSSGIAQDLFNQIDRGFDSQRAQAQGDIAYRQITEQRSREQEAEKLLQYLATLPNAAATGDLQLMQYLDQLITQPGMNTLGMTGQRAALPRQQADTASYFQGLPNMPGQQALATSALLADLPVQRTQLGIQALGLGGQPQSGVSGALSLLENAQYNRMFNQGQQADFWRNLGMGFL